MCKRREERLQLINCAVEEALHLSFFSARLSLNISFVKNETVSFVDASAFVSCHMSIYEELLSDGQCGPKGEEWDEWWKVEEVEESLQAGGLKQTTLSLNGHSMKFNGHSTLTLTLTLKTLLGLNKAVVQHNDQCLAQ